MNVYEWVSEWVERVSVYLCEYSNMFYVKMRSIKLFSFILFLVLLRFEMYPFIKESLWFNFVRRSNKIVNNDKSDFCFSHVCCVSQKPSTPKHSYGIPSAPLFRHSPIFVHWTVTDYTHECIVVTCSVCLCILCFSLRN